MIRGDEMRRALLKAAVKDCLLYFTGSFKAVWFSFEVLFKGFYLLFKVCLKAPILFVKAPILCLKSVLRVPILFA